jgi:hypothetical protein
MVPELGIAIPVSSGSLHGFHEKYLFHGVGEYLGIRSSILFYTHISKWSLPNFSSKTKEINWKI